MHCSDIRGRFKHVGPGPGASEMNGSEIKGRFRDLAPKRGLIGNEGASEIGRGPRPLGAGAPR
eukprot:15477023-Alexandrium_andersonii.AAC.1